MIPQLTQNELMIACQYYIALLDQRTLICFPKGKKTSFLNLEIILFFIRNDCHLRGIIKNKKKYYKIKKLIQTCRLGWILNVRVDYSKGLKLTTLTMTLLGNTIMLA